ncbi:hypothetical protein WJX74_008703 [Apatococcus lobatus]|uniref:SGNH hydrolase-type esterase domain-containing protein n=1 Tax=Apatococcus lobatus TaxID=904363 RepID=A0AAW1QD71_9CHLO
MPARCNNAWLVLALLVYCSSIVSQPVLLQGRLEPYGGSSDTTQLPLTLSWPLSQVTVTFQDSTAITVVLANVSYESPFPFEEDLITQYVAFRSSAAVTQEVSVMDGEARITLSGLPERGPHTAVLTKIDESNHGGCNFVSTPDTPARGIEFIGDSMLTGFGILGTNDSCSSNLCSGSACPYTDASKSWPALVAPSLNATAHVIGWSAAGLTNGGAAGYALANDVSFEDASTIFPNIPDLYIRWDGHDADSVYNFTLFQPQVIVNALGINDFHGTPPPPPIEIWADVYANFTRALQKLRPHAKVVMVQLSLSMVSAYQPQSSDLTQNYVILDPEEYSIYMRYMQAAFARIQSSDISNVSYYTFPEEVGNFTRGCISHPGVKGSRAAADAITPYIRTLEDW